LQSDKHDDVGLALLQFVWLALAGQNFDQLIENCLLDQAALVGARREVIQIDGALDILADRLYYSNCANQPKWIAGLRGACSASRWRTSQQGRGYRTMQEGSADALFTSECISAVHISFSTASSAA
jgi:hypothetical protein